ncbi:hypothetical protein HDA40_000113 [Hamadaea flava]|uniref:Uncharacterized protein n=1 Tax=Hamadaea flava TaxID=1742688 RepID=A0ABV8LYV6_9ACTN|nr:hypothetical protein [Hamadaea flava]MCP2321606.1 hypothetical protein [Hamadaea flava]
MKMTAQTAQTAQSSGLSLVLGPVVDMLTGGQLTTLAQRLLADPQSLRRCADAVLDIVSALNGPSDRIALARKAIDAVWSGAAKETNVNRLLVLDGCFSTTSDGLKNLAEWLARVADLVQQAQRTYNAVVKSGNAAATAQLSIPFGGQAIATVTSWLVVGMVVKIVIQLITTLSGMSDQLKTSSGATAEQTLQTASTMPTGPAVSSTVDQSAVGTGLGTTTAPSGTTSGPTNGATTSGTGSAIGTGQTLTPSVLTSGDWVARDPATTSATSGATGAGTPSGTAQTGGDTIVIKTTKDGVEVQLARPEHDVSLKVEAVIDGKKVTQDIEFDGDGDGKVGT